jgi:hypothetical protein
VRSLNARFAAACSAIDAANAADPTSVEVRGEVLPLALAHGRLGSGWALRLASEPHEAVVIAARAHHLRRWEVPRHEYPEGRAGYLRWRKDQKARHARDVAAILAPIGYSADEISRVQALIRRDNLGSDPDAQLVEDAACLVFIETQLVAMVPRFEREHYLEIIRKTARKMSPIGLAAVGEIPLDATARELLANALAAG